MYWVLYSPTATDLIPRVYWIMWMINLVRGSDEEMWWRCEDTGGAHCPWNNGKEVPSWGLLRYRKCIPQQLGDVIVVTNSPPIGHMRSQLTNHQVGIVLDVQAWSEKLY